MTAFTETEISNYYSVRVPLLERSGPEWRGPCPIHGGSRDSFAVNPLNGSWYCHSECGRGGGLFELEAAIGGAQDEEARTAVIRLIGRKDSTTGCGGDSRIVAEYPYTDPDGALLFQCVRFEPKDFRQRHRTGTAGGLGVWKGSR